MAADTSVALPVAESGVARLRELLRERPLYLGVETTNICNARCHFCAYPKMNRPKTVMAPGLFQKIVDDYVDIRAIASKS